MLGWFLIITCAVIMTRIARMSEQNEALWGAVTFGLCLGLNLFLPFFGIFLGLALSYILMVVVSLRKKD